MNLVKYRGGAVTFEIPENWVEDVDPDDESGVFYEDADDAGLLRLSITTASNPNPVTTEMLTAMLDHLSKAKNKKLETLPNGNVLLSYVTKTRQEDGALLVIYFWLAGNPVPPHHARIANFSYTVQAVHAISGKTQSVVAQLEQSIRKAEFAKESGVTAP